MWSGDDFLDYYFGRTKVSKPLRILVVEDHPDFRKPCEEILKTAGYEVIAVSDGQEAIDKIETAQDGEFDLVITDNQMPRINGFGLKNWIRQNSNPKIQTLPIILFTDGPRPPDVSEFNAFLKKTVGRETLLKTISELLKSSKTE